jgi:hypothetical protein
MPQIVLDGARVVAIVSELEFIGMAKHVRWTGKPSPASYPARGTIFRTLSAVMGPPRSLVKTWPRWSVCSRFRYLRARKLRPPQRVRTRGPILQPADVEQARLEVDGVPPHRDQLGDA